MAEDEQQLKLDRNPSPKDEAKDFQNPDERLQAANNAHEIARIESKKGWIGRLTGSTNESMNTGLAVLFSTLFLLLLSMVGICFKSEFSSVTDNLIKIVLAVVGYIFGTHQSSKS